MAPLPQPSRVPRTRRGRAAAASAQTGADATAGAGREATHAINQRIFETSLDLIFVVDQQGTFIRVSPSSIAILGYRPDEMVGHSGKEFLYAEDLDNTRNEMRSARRDRLAHNFECRYVHKAGRIVALWWTGVWSEPEQQHFFIGRDITTLKATEQRLRERTGELVRTNRQLSAIIAASPAAIFMLDCKGTVTLWNAATCSATRVVVTGKATRPRRHSAATRSITTSSARSS